MCPSTGDLKIPVRKVSPCHSISFGRPTFTDTTRMLVPSLYLNKACPSFAAVPPNPCAEPMKASALCFRPRRAFCASQPSILRADLIPSPFQGEGRVRVQPEGYENDPAASHEIGGDNVK